MYGEANDLMRLAVVGVFVMAPRNANVSTKVKRAKP